MLHSGDLGSLSGTWMLHFLTGLASQPQTTLNEKRGLQGEEGSLQGTQWDASRHSPYSFGTWISDSHPNQHLLFLHKGLEAHLLPVHLTTGTHGLLPSGSTRQSWPFPLFTRGNHSSHGECGTAIQGPFKSGLNHRLSV